MSSQSRRNSPASSSSDAAPMVLRNANVVTDCVSYTADLLIQDERIAAIGQHLDAAGADEVDASLYLTIPGGVDIHTHMDMPFAGTVTSDDFETGTIAAAAGGTTTLVDFAIQSPGGTLLDARDEWLAKALDRSAIDFGLHLIVRRVDDETLREIRLLVADGVTTYKVFLAYPGIFMISDADLFKILRLTSELGALVMIHAENGPIIAALVDEALARGQTSPRYHSVTRPVETEREAVARAIAISSMAAEAAVYFVHISSRAAVEEVRRARVQGHRVFAETCTHYLLLTDERYMEPGFEAAKYVMSPPLRSPDDQTALWRELAAGGLDVVSSDHCPFVFGEGYGSLPAQKALGIDNFAKIPNGVPGVEDRLTMTFTRGVATGELTVNRWVAVTSSNPARLAGIYPRKGAIVVGSDADLVLWDPTSRRTVTAAQQHMRIDYNLYEGMEAIGEPAIVISRGSIVARRREYVGGRGHGRYLKRAIPAVALA
jgi:dihydropyrimidinase